MSKGSRSEGVVVELDQSCFYPSSGGQPNDLGWIEKLPVVDVVEDKGRLLHLLQQDTLRIGQSVEGRIDWQRRFDHMQQHTGQHILSQAFHQILKAQTVSFHLGDEISTIDLNCEEILPEEIYQVEDLANQVIFENRVVQVHSVDEEGQSQFPLRKPSARQGEIRIVEINKFDWSACGGTHCQRTGEVGLLKIRRWDRVKKKARAEFYCGWRALRDYRWKNRALYQLSRLYSSADRDTVEAARRQLERQREFHDDLSRTEEALLHSEARCLVQKMLKIKGIHVICETLEEDQREKAGQLVRKIVADEPNRVVLLAVRGKKPALFFSCSSDLPYDMAEWIRLAAPFIDGRGGGHPQSAQAGGTREAGLEEALRKTLERL
jgi:alanyl-tRNA synthetase